MKRVLDDLKVFCAIVENGSLKQTALMLGIPHSTVSRRVEALETNLGLSLLHRTTREVRVTSRGQQLYEDTRELLLSLDQAVSLTIDAEVRFKGQLKVSMPTRAGIDFLGGWLIDFSAEHPELQLDIELSNVNQHLVQDEIDLAFRVGPLVDSSAIAVHLWDIPYGLYAHKDLVQALTLNPNAISVEQLKTLPGTITLPAKQWAFMDSNREEVLLSPKAELCVDDLGLSYHSLLKGTHIAMLPKMMVESDNLVELTMEGLTPRTRKMYAYYLGRRHANSQIRHIIDYVKNRYQQRFSLDI